MSRSGPQLPGYAVERLFGRGGSGEVWSARVSATGERVALKWISGGPTPAGRREAALLTALDHPHLVRLHDVVPDRDGAAVLVLDLADGGSLAELLAARGRLAAGEVITALSPVASALAHAHAHGVVHGDVTPGNILFTSAGLPLLADLGVARLRGDLAVVDGTRCTPAYVDPAVAAGSVPGPPSDVFMVAAVAVHALTGAPVWAGDSSDEILEAAATGDAGDLAGRLRAAHVPEAVAAVVLRATSADPANRGSAAEFALDLRHAAEPVPVDLEAGRRVHTSTMTAVASGSPRPAGPRHARADPDSTPGAAVVFTRLLRPRPRPALPRHGFGGRSRRPVARWAVSAAVAVAVLAGAGGAWAAIGSSTARHTGGGTSEAAVGLPVVPSGGGTDEQLGTTTAAASDTPESGTASPIALTSAQAVVVLTELDDLRQHAFARRAPLLLTGVYPPGALLDEDTRLLAKLVPEACGLEGVHTTYDQVTVVGHAAGRIDLTTRATLAPSVLVCSGKATAQAPGSAPAVLHITLVWRGHGYLVGDIRR
ncbi:MAG: eukaryotic-like serine/threonine-protein kinase [Pseudonocardiales bacterium]|nr:eukaryotic-like serine/threonine-protein kinase [Pseudonocardiales bacterium]